MRSASGVLTTGQTPAFKAVKRWSSTGHIPAFGQPKQADRQWLGPLKRAAAAGPQVIAPAPTAAVVARGGGWAGPRPGRGSIYGHAPACVCVYVWTDLHLS